MEANRRAAAVNPMTRGAPGRMKNIPEESPPLGDNPHPALSLQRLRRNTCLARYVILNEVKNLIIAIC